MLSGSIKQWTKSRVFPPTIISSVLILASAILWLADLYFSSAMMRSTIAVKIMPLTLFVCAVLVPFINKLLRIPRFAEMSWVKKLLFLVLFVLALSYAIGQLYFSVFINFPFRPGDLPKLILQNLFVISLPFWLAIIGLISLHYAATTKLTTTANSADQGVDKEREYISASFGNRIFVLNPQDIIWAKAEGNYVKIFTHDRFYLRRSSLAALLSSLQSNFIRIHRSYLVNINFVENLANQDHGDLSISLKSGELLKCSRNYAPAVKAMLGY